MRAGSYADDEVGGTRRCSQKTDAKTAKSRELAERGFVLFSTATPTGYLRKLKKGSLSEEVKEITEDEKIF